MAGFQTSEWIKQRPEVVFQFMTNPENASKVMHNVVKMEKLTNGPVGAGTRFRETRRVQGKEHQTELEVIAYKPAQQYSVAAEQSGVRVIYHYQLASEREGTRIELNCEVTANGLKKFVLPLVVGVMKKEDGNHLSQLKAAVETVQGIQN
jgi:hypothetical protein